jgi:hypothetical protein
MAFHQVLHPLDLQLTHQEMVVQDREHQDRTVVGLEATAAIRPLGEAMLPVVEFSMAE